MQSAACPAATDEPHQSDRQLIQSALSGDQDGYEQLVRRYQDRLAASIRLNVGCPTLTEDIVQDAFIQAFLHLRSFRSESNFYTWLFRIAMNSRRAYFRNRPQSQSMDLFDEDVRQPPAERRDSPADAVERREQQVQVREALTRLDENYRVILVLREFEGFDYQTIAEVLKLSLGTVRSRLSRARAQMRRELSAYVA